MKNQMLRKVLFAASNIAGDLTTAAFDVRFLDNVFINCQLTGTPNGVLYVEASDLSDNDSIWNSFTQAVVTDASKVSFDIFTMSAPWVRLRWAAGMGSVGTLSAAWSGKAI